MTARASNWARLPAEMKACHQWCIAGEDKVPLAVSSDGTIHKISSTDPRHWMDFNSACHAAYQRGLHIGFVLHANDPFTCIDLDVKDVTNEPNPALWTTQEQYDRFWAIVQGMDSYTERSRSGKGLHIWVLGNIGQGVRRDGVEVYSQERYIISTGDVIVDKPMQDRQAFLNQMVSQMRPAVNLASLLEEVEEAEDDHTIIERAINAGNADKFNALCACTSSVGEGDRKVHGSYVNLGFPSQSEADLALMSIFTFYSKSNEQCRRLFRMTGLGKRPKAVQDDRYLNTTLGIIRGRQAREANVEVSAIQQTAALMASLQGPSVRNAPLLHVPGAPEPIITPAPVSAAMALEAPTSAAVAEVKDKGISWPPGLAGVIAGFIYQSAPRPVKEVAVVAALGFLAGVCGKAWCIPQSGLNMYLVLIARSAVGKEAMHSGLSALIASAASRQPAVMQFVDFSDFASGPALVKAVAANPCFVNVAGEWGRKLKRMSADDGRDSPLQALRTVMTNLYQKSGPQSIVGGITYSNKDSNIASVSGVAYSMIGESTPKTFYDSLTESMMEDGFLSRFTIVEYNGDRPPLNLSPVREPSKALGDSIAELCTYALSLISRHEVVAVSRTEEAANIMMAFEHECDHEINSTQDETWRQMWNRASLKVMRVSALLAVADNWLHPVITKDHVVWSLELIRRDIAIMSSRVRDGDVGTGDAARENKAFSVIIEYLKRPVPESYGCPEPMRKAGIIPRKYLQVRCGKSSSFMAHRMGSNIALDAVIKSMIDNGYLMEVDKGKMVEAYGFHGKAYRIITTPSATQGRE